MSLNDMHHVAKLYASVETNDIRSALHAIPASIDYEHWWRVGAALKSELGEAGFYVFDEWSRGSDQYKQSEVRQKWRSFKRNGITIKTVFRLAIDNGWSRPKDFNYTPRPVDKDLLAREHKAERLKHVQAAITAQAMWNAAVPETSHPYLQNKGIQDHGTRVLDDALLIPMGVGTKIWSVQRIYPNCRKYFLAGGRVNGCYFSIGKLDNSLWICEGFATGASIFESTRDAVAVAFSCGNLARVAAYFRKYHPSVDIQIAADADAPGKSYGVAAMKAGIASRLVFPDFKPGDAGKDWNDHAALYGKAETLEALNS
jgi:putative DNA primase/helicase